MAFGKKKDGASAEVEDESVDDIAPDDDAPAAEDAPEATLEPADDVPEPAAPQAAAAPPPAGADALLSMFQESKEDIDDLSVLIDLAGDTDIDDILEELRTLRAALGITDAYDDEAELAAAA